MDKRIYREYVAILKEELQPAMGCTEPIAVAYCAALARQTLGALPETVEVLASANIIKNVKSVIVPNTNGLRGIAAAAVDESLPNDRCRGINVPPFAARAGVVGAQSVGRRARDDQSFGYERRGVERPTETFPPYRAVAARVVSP